MNRPRLALILPLLLGWSMALAAPPAVQAIAKPGTSPQKEHPDGSVKCPVTGHMLPKDKGVMAKAQGHAYRVEDAAAAKELEAHPELYLRPDGTPKNQ